MTEQLVELPGLLRIRERFMKVHHDRHDRLEILLQQVERGEDTIAALTETRAVVHTISGTAGSLGFAALSAAAGDLDYLLDHHLESGSTDHAPMAAAIDRFLDTSLDTLDPTAFGATAATPAVKGCAAK